MRGLLPAEGRAAKDAVALRDALSKAADGMSASRAFCCGRSCPTQRTRRRVDGVAFDRTPNRSQSRFRCHHASATGGGAGVGLSMFGIGPATRIYLAAGTTDMRKGFEWLFGYVRD